MAALLRGLGLGSTASGCGAVIWDRSPAWQHSVVVCAQLLLPMEGDSQEVVLLNLFQTDSCLGEQI